MTVAHLDTLVRTGARVSDAVDVLSREQLRALADRFDLDPTAASTILRIQVKRRLVAAGGLVRASRAK
jgi:hypothetical protein